MTKKIKGRKPTKLNKTQKKIIADIVDLYYCQKQVNKELKKLFEKAKKKKIPITQLAYMLGINKVSVWNRYNRKYTPQK